MSRRKIPPLDAGQTHVVDKVADALKTGLVGRGSDEIIEWWLKTARGDAERAIPKALAYGASDLLVIGSCITPKLSDKQRIEAAIAFYATGKCARITGALTEGRDPGDDSWLDLGVYSFMGRYAREHGRWP